MFAKPKLAVGAFHTDLWEATINVANSAVNTALPTATSMRNETTDRNLE